MFNKLKKLFKKENKPVALVKSYYTSTTTKRQNDTVEQNTDDSFLTSMAIGAVIHDGLLGGMIGGDLVGGMIGEMITEPSHSDPCNNDSYSSSDSSSSYDSSSSSYDSGSSYDGGSCSSSD